MSGQVGIICDGCQVDAAGNRGKLAKLASTSPLASLFAKFANFFQIWPTTTMFVMQTVPVSTQNFFPVSRQNWQFVTFTNFSLLVVNIIFIKIFLIILQMPSFQACRSDEEDHSNCTRWRRGPWRSYVSFHVTFRSTILRRAYGIDHVFN